jgi:hypothetical protein
MPVCRNESEDMTWSPFFRLTFVSPVNTFIVNCRTGGHFDSPREIMHGELRRYIMKKFMTIAFSVFLFGCVTKSEFILTGVKHEALPENTEVKVVAWGDSDRYEIIGIADVGQYSLDERIEEVKRIARLHGGDVIMPKGLQGSESREKIDREGYLLQSFLVMRMKDEVPEVAIKDASKMGDDDKLTADKELQASIEKYKNLPRATYKLLVNDYRTLKGELFKGSLYPKRYYPIPARLRSLAGRDKQMLLVTTRSGKYKLFLLVPKNMNSKFKGMIRQGKKLNFVYSPVDIYVTRRGRYPVLKYVDDIRE